MAFALINFQFARGIDSCYTQGQGVTTVTHTYRSLTDSASTILTDGYFPPYIDGTVDKVFANDTILIIAADQVVMAKVLTVTPLTTLSQNVFSAGGITTTYTSTFSDRGLSITSPITFTVSKVDRLVTISLSPVNAGTTASSPGAFYTSLTALPSEYRPPVLADGYLKIVQNGNVISQGEIQVTVLGDVSLWASPNHVTLFTASVSLGFDSATIVYFTA